MKIIDFSSLNLYQRKCVDGLTLGGMRAYTVYVFQKLRLARHELKSAQSEYERDLIIEIALCANKRRKTQLRLKLLRERTRQLAWSGDR